MGKHSAKPIPKTRPAKPTPPSNKRLRGQRVTTSCPICGLLIEGRDEWRTHERKCRKELEIKKKKELAEEKRKAEAKKELEEGTKKKSKERGGKGKTYKKV